MKHYNFEEALSRIQKHHEHETVRVVLADIVVPKVINQSPPKPKAAPDPKDNNDDDENKDSDNEDDSDDNNSDDSDDSDDDSTDPGDALKTFPSTATTQPIYDRLQAFGDQAYIVAEILNQVEGFKGAGDTNNMQRALAALRAALTDMADIQNKSKNEITKYLNTIKG